MNNDDDTSGEPSAFVSGFERAPHEPPKQTGEDDFFETGIREARAARERRRQPNPAPRPAVRATVPTQRRMAAPPPPRHDGDPTSMTPPEDAYDTFRQRYNPGELISPARGGRPVRNVPPVQGSERRPAPQHYDEDAVNPLRYLLLFGVIVCLGVFIFLLVRLSSVRSDLADARATIQTMQDESERYHLTAEQRDHWYDEYHRISLEHEYLQLRYAQLSGAGTTDPGTQQPGTGDSDQPTTTEPPTTEPPFPRVHVLQQGQTVSAVAEIHYGRRDWLLVLHILSYNNLSEDAAARLPAGATINVPAPPS